MADAETLRYRLCRKPTVVAPGGYDALIDLKELPALGPAIRRSRAAGRQQVERSWVRPWTNRLIL
jgi:hypothetical protein